MKEDILNVECSYHVKLSKVSIRTHSSLVCLIHAPLIECLLDPQFSIEYRDTWQVHLYHL